jgi:hypothetical protein
MERQYQLDQNTREIYNKLNNVDEYEEQFKGFSAEQLKEIGRIQAEQREENKVF